MTNQPASSTIVPRKIDFSLNEESPRFWYQNDPALTHLFNAVMIMFPEGEKFFVHAVNHFKHRITDPQLAADVREFVRQEINHSKAHGYFNEQLTRQGYDIESLEIEVEQGFRKAKRVLGKKMQLAIVIAYEHLTAIYGDIVLKDTKWLEGVDPAYADLLRWHAAEEVEHKAVAYNVYRAIGGDYPTRVAGMLIAGYKFNRALILHTYSFLKHDGKHTSAKTWWSLFRFLFIRPASFFQLTPSYLRYFLPGFHPNDISNSDLVEQWETEFYEPASTPAKHSE
jgi:predicted metal-dependent hydrolase